MRVNFNTDPTEGSKKILGTYFSLDSLDLLLILSPDIPPFHYINDYILYEIKLLLFQVN
jgi:hypothetical protein